MIARALIPLLLLVTFVGSGSADDRKEWVKLTDCHYVDALDNDGDSFRIRGGDKEFTARLYYVDAPETNLRQGEGEAADKGAFAKTVRNLDAMGDRRRPRPREPILCDC